MFSFGKFFSYWVCRKTTALSRLPTTPQNIGHFPMPWSYGGFFLALFRCSDCKICIVHWFPKLKAKTLGRLSVQSHNHLLLRVLGPKGNWQWLPLRIPFQNHGKLVWCKYYNMKLVPLWTLPGFCSYDYSSLLKSQLCKTSYLYVCMAIKHTIVLFVETPRKIYYCKAFDP
jgi:hypothetical protein